MSQLYLLHTPSGRTLRLSSEAVRAGSEAVCELRLGADAPARVASLRPLDGGWFLRDESGGTRIPRVNGAAALQVVLSVGDRIELAGEEWVLKKGDPAQAKVAPSGTRAAAPIPASSAAATIRAAAVEPRAPIARSARTEVQSERRVPAVPKKPAPRWIPWAIAVVVGLIMCFAVAWFVRVDPVAALKTSVRQKMQELAGIALEGDAAARERQWNDIESYLKRLDQLGETEYAAEQRRLLERRAEKERELFALYDMWWGSPAALTDELVPYLDERTESDPGLRRLAQMLKEKALQIPIAQRSGWRAPGEPGVSEQLADEDREATRDPGAASGGAESRGERGAEKPAVPAEPASAAQLAYEAGIAAIEQLASGGHWAAALELARLDLNESASRADDGFGVQRAEHARQLHLRTLVALQDLRDRVRSLRDDGKSTSALNLLRERLADFPADGEFDQLRPLERELEARLLAFETEAKRGPAIPKIAPALAEAEVGEALKEARDLENALRFAEARARLEPARSTRDEESRALVESALREIDGESQALEMLGAWIASDPDAAEKVSLKIGAERGHPIAASAAGVEVALEGGERKLVPWAELGGANVQRLHAKARGKLDAEARFFGALLVARLIPERSPESASLAEQLVASMEEVPARREIFAAFLARLRGEAVPAGGYEWFEGRWITLKERNTLLEAQEIKALLAKLDSADGAERQAAADELALRGVDAHDALLVALNARAEEIAAALRETKIQDDLQKIAALRAQLDTAREHALQLIYDQEMYFYPYRPPECPPEKAKLYPGVQQEVDRRVQAVRAIWESPLAVRLPKAVRTHCAALRELEKLGAQFGLDVTGLSADVAWAYGVEAQGSEPMGVRELGTSHEEARRLLHDRLLLAWNRAAAEQAGASSQEIRQVEITNEYRRMLGRGVVAWNAKLQRATRGHSDEMSRLGYFSHFSPTPARRTPAQRMGLEGYGRGHGENIATNGGADGAHVAWTHSSGHHRNLLSASHTEMATGNAGSYWTQNFGGLREFLQDPLWIELAERAGL